MQERSGSTFGAILVEMVSIVVAIVLGFAVSRWNEVRQERARADAAERISSELQADQRALDGLMPYYDRVGSTVDSIIETEGDLSVPTAIALDTLIPDGTV